MFLATTTPFAQDWVIRKDGRPMTGMVSSGNRLVAFGAGAGLWVKEDGKPWNTVRVPGNTTIDDMIWTGSMFAGITSRGDFILSTDGSTWQVRKGVLDWVGAPWKRILWMNDSFTVFAGPRRIARVSRAFGVREYRTDLSGELQQILQDGDSTIMVLRGSQGDTIASSRDGASWSRIPTTRPRLSWIQRDGAEWIATRLDSFFRSPDLRTWIPTPTLAVDTAGKKHYLGRVYSHGGRLWNCAEYDMSITTSEDGRVWRRSWSTKGNLTVEGLAFAPTGSGAYLLAADNMLLRMPDSVQGWTIEREHMVNYLQGVAYKNNAIHVHGHYFAQLESRDGLDWSIKRGLHEFAPMGWVAVADFGDDKLVPLGRTLSMLRTADTNVMIDESPRCGWAGGGRRVIVGDAGMIAVSDDGSIWQDLKLESRTHLRFGMWHDGLHVAVGDTILTSPDGLTWTGRRRPIAVELQTVARSPDRWIAIGGGGLFTSPDGLAWEDRAYPDFPSMKTVRYGGGKFIAVGSNGVVLSSRDGLVWDSTNIGASIELDDVAWTGAGWVAVGQYGIVATLGDPVVPAPVDARERTPLSHQARWNGRFLSTPTGTVSVDLIDPMGRIVTHVPGADGRIDLRALHNGVWFARGTGAQAWTLRLVR